MFPVAGPEHPCAVQDHGDFLRGRDDPALRCRDRDCRAAWVGPGPVAREAQDSIGALIRASPAGAREGVGILDFLAQVIPANIFEALSTNQVMSIVLLSVSLGLAMGVIQTPATEQFLGMVETIHEDFMTNNPILAWPVAIDILEQDQGVDRRLPELVIPFGIFFNEHGGVFLLSFLTLFFARIYGADLGCRTTW